MDFQAVQHQFAAHLRDPARNPAPPGIEERRLQVYRDLFYNNVEGFLASAYPVLRKISTDEAWHGRVRDFYARHQCHAPQFHRIAEEFLRFLEEERGDHPDDPPFLRELCHYEWVELALSIAPDDIAAQPADPHGDLLDGRPLVSPLAWTLAYAYPVHRIGPDHQPSRPGAQPTCLVVYRNRADEVRFMEINAVTARLLASIEEEPGASGRELLLRIAAELQHPEPDAVVAGGEEILRSLKDRDIILGIRS